MPVELNIVESVTELDTTVVDVILTSASEPGPAGPGVAAGGTAGQVLTKDSGTDFDTSWQDATGGGAPDDVDYLVGTASGSLSAEIVVGTSPGGELGGTWASPTVDATHSGSSHAGVQAAAEATAAAALASHEADTTGIHGIADTSALALTANAVMDGDAAGGVLSGTYPNPGFAADMATQAELDAHTGDTSAAHAASAISADSTTLVGTGTDVQAVLEELDNGIADHIADATAAHAATAISFSPAGTIAATTVQAAIEEVASEAGGGGVPSLQYESRSSNTILGVADKGKTIDITAAITQTFEADETLGDGWWVILRNATDDGTTVVTLNPDGTETIDGLGTVTMYSGEARMIFCNGTGANFNSTLLSGGFALFTANGSFVVPHGITQAQVVCFGAGGGGGGGAGSAAGSTRLGGGGGGGGARVELILAASSLGNPGDAVSVTVPSGGASGTGGSSGAGNPGTTGDTTSFGSLVSAHGGGGGAGGVVANTWSKGGTGGGEGEAGQQGTTGVGTLRGGANITAAAQGFGTAGGGNNNAAGAYPAQDGGGAGGGGFTVGQVGGTSVRGGGGGGGGGGLTTGNAEVTGAVGGGTGIWRTVNAGSGGGAAGAADGGAGGNGDDGAVRGGAGGGGGGSQASGTGGAGGNGGAPGGGAGGGGGGTSTGGAGGTGGRGECRVWYS